MARLPEWVKGLAGEKDDYLQSLTRKASNIREIENTRGFQDILSVLDSELAWARAEMERVPIFHFNRLQEYIRALQLIRSYILHTPRMGDAAAEELTKRIAKAQRRSIDDYHDLVFSKK